MQIFEVPEGDGKAGLIMSWRYLMDCALGAPRDEARVVLGFADDIVQILMWGFDDAWLVKGYWVR